VDVTLEQEGVSDENMCNGHGTHSLTSVLSRQRGTRRVTVQHLRERTLLYVCCGWEPWHGRVIRVTGGSHIVVRPECVISCAFSSTAPGLTPSGGLRLTRGCEEGGQGRPSSARLDQPLCGGQS
jgi:hypothetical protein